MKPADRAAGRRAITYVAAQMGHAKVTTTLQHYAKWLPKADSHRYVDALDQQPAAVDTTLMLQSARHQRVYRDSVAPIWHQATLRAEK
jgi:hypothetical protein